MSLSYSFDPAGRICTIHYASEPTLDEWRETMLAVIADPRFSPSVGLLFDRHRLAGAPSAEFVQGAADFVSEHQALLSRVKTAVVIGNPGAYGMARVGQALLDPHGVSFRIFESLAEAEAWLLKDD